MSWYLKARSIHPQSAFAEEGIQRVLDEVLPNDGATAGATVDVP
jgi:hypothetical protein